MDHLPGSNSNALIAIQSVEREKTLIYINPRWTDRTARIRMKGHAVVQAELQHPVYKSNHPSITQRYTARPTVEWHRIARPHIHQPFLHFRVWTVTLCLLSLEQYGLPDATVTAKGRAGDGQKTRTFTYCITEGRNGTEDSWMEYVQQYI